VSSIPNLTATTLGGIAAGLFAGYSLCGAYLWRTRRALRAARHAAGHDETTGLANRRTLYRHLRTAARRQRRIAVAVLDLDGFKTVNDRHGHHAGDLVLAQVAARLAALPAPTLLAARLSGDEFALLIDDHTGDALVAAHQAWRTIADTPFRLPDGKPVGLTASVGVTVCRVGVDPRLLLHHADLAMYAAKRDQGGVRLFTPEPHAGPEHLAARPGVRPRDRWQRQASEPSTADSYLPHHPR